MSTCNVRVVRQSKRRLIALALAACTALAPLSWAAAPGDLQYQREGEEAEGSPFPPSIFPHWSHRVRYRCDACHDRLFTMEAGATPVTMDLIEEGKACGACHNGELAFDSGFANCSRCHREPED